MKRRILFVDDEFRVLQGLKRMLRPMRAEWNMTFVGSGAQALEELQKQRFDVIVTDMRMPEMDGADLLTKVMDRHPWMVRIVLSGESDHSQLLKSARPAHQFLSKPCNPEELKETVARACGLRDVVTNETVREMVSQIDHLQSLPDVYTQLVNALQADDASTARVGKIINKDVGMTMSILKIVNSSFFGMVRRISDPVQAVGMLGLEIVSGLVLSAHLMSIYDESSVQGFSLKKLWQHCFNTASLAKEIAATVTNDRKIIGDCYIVGLLHDVGKLVIGVNLSEAYNDILDQVRRENRMVWEIENEKLGMTHAEVGAYLLGLWGLPDSMVEAVAFHHNPSKNIAKGFTPLTAVHIADRLERQLVIINAEYAKPEFDKEYLAKTDFLKKIPQWKALAESYIGGMQND